MRKYFAIKDTINEFCTEPLTRIWALADSTPNG